MPNHSSASDLVPRRPSSVPPSCSSSPGSTTSWAACAARRSPTSSSGASRLWRRSTAPGWRRCCPARPRSPHPRSPPPSTVSRRRPPRRPAPSRWTSSWARHRCAPHSAGRCSDSVCFSVLDLHHVSTCCPHTNAATQQILRNEAQSGAARGPLSVSRQGEDAPLAHATSSASQQGQHVVRPCLQPPRVPGTGPPAAPSLGRAIPETHTHREAAPPDPPPIRDPPWRTDPLNRAWTQDSLSTALSQLTVLGPDDADSSEAGSDASTATFCS